MSGSRDTDDDDINMRSAKALLIMADVIANGREGEEKVDMFDALSKLNGIQPGNNWSTLSTLMKDLKYFASTGVSTRWTASEGGFRDVLNGSYAMRCEPIDEDVKTRVRGKFKCTLCGQLEKNCNYIVHFAGRPPVERGQELAEYSAASFETVDPEKLTDAYSTYAECYNESSSILCDESEKRWPASNYLGLVAPGQKCLQSIFTAFSAKDLVRSTIDAAFLLKASVNAPLNHARVRAYASRIAHIREAATGQRSPPFQNTDHEFWLETMQRFSDGLALPEGDTFSRLRAGYLRMEMNVKKTGYTPLDDDEDDEDDEEGGAGSSSAGRARSSRSQKRPRIVLDTDSEEEEDDVDDEDGSDEDFVAEDDDDDDAEHDDEDEEEGAGPSVRWGSTAASRAGPFAKRRRTSEEPFAPRQTRSARRRTDVNAEPDTESDPVSVALRKVDKNTAAALRIPPNNAIGSRRSTIKKLARVGVQLLEDGDLAVASGTLDALARLTSTLDTHERGAGLSDYQKTTMLKEVQTQLRPVRDKLLAQGHTDNARDVAEAIIVAYELLS